MHVKRRLRRTLTVSLAVLSLLFSQLALANYICPGAAAPEQMVEVMASGEPCSGMDDVAPVLCHQHAIDTSQSFETAKVATTPTLPALVQTWVLPVLLDSERVIALSFSDAPEIRPRTDPLYLQTLRLRV